MGSPRREGVFKRPKRPPLSALVRVGHRVRGVLPTKLCELPEQFRLTGIQFRRNLDVHVDEEITA